MRRSPRLRYPYFPGDPDPYIHPLQSFGPAGGPPPPPAPPPLAPPADPNADIFAALERLTSLLASIKSGAATPVDVERVPRPAEEAPRYPGNDAGPLWLMPDPPRPAPIGDYSDQLASPSSAWLPRDSTADYLLRQKSSISLLEPPAPAEEPSGTSDAQARFPSDPYAQGEWQLNEDAAPLELANLGGPPRFYLGPGGRPLSPAEQLRWSNYLHALELLREVNPRHPQLQSLHGPHWVPDDKDIADVWRAVPQKDGEPVYRAPELDLHLGPLWREIGKLRGELGLQSLEWHHPMPTQYRKWFNDNGIPESLRNELGYYMSMREHRGAGGLHPYWNRSWKPITGRFPDLSSEAISQELLELLHRYGQLRTP
jgi:hypothetical protein